MLRVPLRIDQVDGVKASLTGVPYEPMVLFRKDALVTAIDVPDGCDIHLSDGQVVHASITTQWILEQLQSLSKAEHNSAVQELQKSVADLEHERRLKGSDMWIKPPSTNTPRAK